MGKQVPLPKKGLYSQRKRWHATFMTSLEIHGSSFWKTTLSCLIRAMIIAHDNRLALIGYLLWVGHLVKFWIFSFNPNNYIGWEMTLIPLFRWQNQGSVRLVTCPTSHDLQVALRREGCRSQSYWGPNHFCPKHGGVSLVERKMLLGFTEVNSV